MAGKLPKVTEYIKNVGKSMGYASIDVVKDTGEGMGSFIETNEDFFKTVYSAAKNYKKTLITTGKIIKKSKIYEAAVAGIQATKEDIASGNWYNKERDKQFQMEAFGEDFADFSDFDFDPDKDDWDMDSDEDIVTKEPSPSESRSSTDKMIAQAALGSTSAVVGVTREQTRVIANSTESLANVSIASAKLFSMQNEKMHASVLAGFQDVHSGLGIITQFATGPMTQFMNESTKFFGDTSTKLAEISAYLKESTEMQRNLYKAKDVEYKTSKYDEVSSSGIPDIKAYSKAIFKNIKDLDPTGGMIFGNGDEDNMFKGFAGSPLKMLPITIMKSIIPTTVRSTIKAFDQNIQQLFPTFIAKMNDWAENSYSDGINWKGIIGSILGIKIDKKEKIDTSKYQKGPMPFDGVTKRAIVDVIPKYLARIESALSGQPERLYDYDSGSFKSLRQIHKEWKKKQRWSWGDATYDIKDDYEKWAKEWATDHSENDEEYSDLRKKLKSAFQQMSRKIFKEGGVFNPYNEDYARDAGFIDGELTDFVEWMKNKGKQKKIYSIADNAIQARQDRARSLERIESDFGNQFRALFDNGIVITDSTGKIVKFDPNNGLGENENDLFQRDKKFKTTNDYLKRILANIEYIRSNGIPNNGLNNSENNNESSSSNKSIDDFIREYDDNFENTEIKEEDYKRKDKEKKKSRAEELGISEDNIKDFRVVKGFTGKWKSLKGKMDDLLNKPSEWIVGIIKKADERIFDIMFGSEEREKKRRDKEGREYNGFLDYITTRASEIFDDLSKKLKDTFNKTWEKIKNSALGKKILGFGEKVKGALGDKFKFIKKRGKEAYDSTYGRILTELRRRGALNSTDLEELIDDENDWNGKYLGQVQKVRRGDTLPKSPTQEREQLPEEKLSNNNWDDNDLYLGGGIDHSAYGRVVKKYGLSMLSPGEIVIPNRGKGRQRRDLMNEKKEKNKILKVLGSSKIAHYASGTVENPADTKPKKKSDTQTLNDQIKKIMHEISGGEADIVADSLLGSGVSLLTGAIGGPLLGAAIGASYGLVKHSDFLQNQLFGEKDENGNRKGGIIPKSTIEFFNKHTKGMVDFGAAGAIAGLFTPFGLVGGAMAGAALGYAKDTKGFKDFMFGNEAEGKNGVISKETQEKLKKAFPNIAIGAGAGMLFGPLGLIGNLAIGSIAGYASTTETFKDIVLGKIGDDKKRHGGIVGAFRDGLVLPLVNKGKEIVLDLAQFTAKHIFEPVELMFKTSTQFVKNMFVSVGDRIVDGLNGMFREHIGMPIEEYLREKVFKRISWLLGGIAKIPLTLAKFTIGAPFEAMRAMGNIMMMGQINRGTSFIQSAAERNKERKKHKIINGTSKIVGVLTGGHGGDKFAHFDKQLEGMSAQDLYLFNENLSKFINNRGKATKEYGDKIDDIGSMISKHIDQNGGWNNQDKYDGKKQILEALQRGERPNDALLKRYGLESLRGKLDEIDMDDLMASRSRMLDEKGMNNEAIKQLEKVTGIKGLHGFMRGNNINLRRMLRVSQGEFKVKEAAEKEGAENLNEDGSNPGIPKFEERTAENTTKLVTILSSINNYLANPEGRTAGKTFDESGNLILHNKNVEKQHDREEKAKEFAEQNPEIAKLIEERDNRADQRTGWRSFKDKITLKYVRRAIGNFFSGKKDEDEDEKAVNSDTIEGQEREREKEHEENFKDNLIDRLTGISYDRDSDKKEKEKEEKQKPSLISRIFGAFSGGAGAFKVVGGLGLKVLSGTGTLVAGLTALSIAGWGSEFFKTKIIPWAKEHVAPFFGNLFTKIGESETFVKIKEGILWFKEKLTDGSLMAAFVNRMTQGVGFAIKNIVAPLTEAVISSFPSLITGVVTGIINGTKKLIFGEKTTVKTNFNNALNAATNSMPVGKNENEIASDFSGGTWSRNKVDEFADNGDNIGGGASRSESTSSNRPSGGVSRSEITSSNNIYDTINNASITQQGVQAGDNYEGNRYTEEDGSITEVDSTLGKVNRYSADGTFLGSYSMKDGSIVDRAIQNSRGDQGTLLHSGLQAFGKGLATGKMGILAKAAGAIGKKISIAGTAKSFLNFATATKGITGTIAGSIKAAGKITAGVINKANKLGVALNSKIGANGDLLNNIITRVTNILTKAFSPDGPVTKWLVRWIPEGIVSLGGKVIKAIIALIKKLSDSVLGKLLNKLLSRGFLNAVFWIKALTDGWTQTESILGVAKGTIEITTGMRVITTLVHAITENVTFGFIPTKDIMDMVLNIFGGFFKITKEELDEARIETEERLTQLGIETGKAVTLKEYNNQVGLGTKFLRLLGIKKDPMKEIEKNYKTTSGFGRATKNTDEKDILRGSGRGGKQGGQFANLPYGNSTIGEAGCGPVAASMLTGDSIPGLASFAQKTGHVAPDGSTDIGFFDDYLSAKGISHTTTTDRTLTEKALKNGGNAVLLGRDPGGGNESAYSDSSHYITAQGMDSKGNVLINDPELGNRVMNKNKVFRNMKASVVTGRSRGKLGYRGYGREGPPQPGDELTPEELATFNVINKNNSTVKGRMNTVTNSIIPGIPDNATTTINGQTINLTANAKKQTNITSGDDNAEKIVRIARGEIGNKERTGKNDIKYNDEYWGSEVSGSSYPWCCAFVWWVFHRAGADSLITKTARCTVLKDWFAAKNQIVYNPKPGDIVFFDFNGNKKITQHVGICSKASTDGGKTIMTIEGNTSSGNSGSQDNGGCVAERKRDMSLVSYVARPAYAGATFDDVAPYGASVDYETGETDANSGPLTLFEKIAKLGKTVMKGMYGEGLYNAVFGTESAEDAQDIANLGTSNDQPLPSNVTEGEQLEGANIREKIWKYLRSLNFSKAGTAGIMGNMEQESSIDPGKVQYSFTKKTGIKSADYTYAINNGSYDKNKFTKDNAGYGLAQWTYSTRKAGLYDRTVAKGKSISDPKEQIDYLVKELDDYGLGDSLRNAADVNAASDVFLTKFEKPGNYGVETPRRRNYSKAIYDQFSGLGRRSMNSATGMTGKAREAINSSMKFNTNKAISTVGTSSNNINIPKSSNNLPYAVFLETIVNILLSISSNTDALTKILNILSKNFNIDVSTSEVQNTTKNAKKQARQALNTLMNDKTDAETVSHMLQTKDTNWLIQSMTELAKE